MLLLPPTETREKRTRSLSFVPHFGHVAVVGRDDRSPLHPRPRLQQVPNARTPACEEGACTGQSNLAMGIASKGQMGRGQLGRGEMRPRPGGPSIADGLAVAAAAALTFSLGVRFTSGESGGHTWPFLAGAPVGFFLADVASALVHWFFDAYFDPNTPIIGRHVVAPFREHHVAPEALMRHGLLERNANNCLAALPLLAATCAVFDLGRPWPAFVSGSLATASVTLCVSNQIHAWAHAQRPPALVRWLQRAGVLLGRERHAAHHQGAHTRAYATVSGWSNPLLDGARVLDCLEALLAATGISRRTRVEPP